MPASWLKNKTEASLNTAASHLTDCYTKNGATTTSAKTASDETSCLEEWKAYEAAMNKMTLTDCQIDYSKHPPMTTGNVIWIILMGILLILCGIFGGAKLCDGKGRYGMNDDDLFETFVEEDTA